jgi:hypothetical protein
VILHIEFSAEGERWHVHVAETGFTRDEPNRMAYDARGQVVSVGSLGAETGTEEDRVVPIYDAVTFDPNNTARCVLFYAQLAHQEVRRGLAHVLDPFDRYDLTLDLPGYPGIAPGLRDAFEHDLEAITFARSYSINGSARK